MAYYNGRGRGWGGPWFNPGRGRGRFSPYQPQQMFNPLNRFNNIAAQWQGMTHQSYPEATPVMPMATGATANMQPQPATVYQLPQQVTPQVTVVREPVYITRDPPAPDPPAGYREDRSPRAHERYRDDRERGDRTRYEPRRRRSPDNGARGGRGRGPRQDGIGSSLQRIESRLSRIEQRKRRRHHSTSSSDAQPQRRHEAREGRPDKPEGAAGPDRDPKGPPAPARKESKDVRMRGTHRHDSVGTIPADVTEVPDTMAMGGSTQTP